MTPAALIRRDTTGNNNMSEAARFLGGCAIIDGPSMRVPMISRVISKDLQH